MCPIVPTFTCGLFLSNFCFAISSYSFTTKALYSNRAHGGN
jgi:hypothetical protein